MTDNLDKPRMKTIDDIADEIIDLLKTRFVDDFENIELESLVMLVPDMVEFMEENYKHFLGRNKKHIVLHTCKRILDQLDLDESVKEVMKKTISVSIDSLIHAYKNRIFLKKKTSKIFGFCCKK